MIPLDNNNDGDENNSDEMSWLVLFWLARDESQQRHLIFLHFNSAPLLCLSQVFRHAHTSSSPQFLLMILRLSKDMIDLCSTV